jgi:hypothetical protein
LLYTLEQGPTEKAILEQCYRLRQPVPDKIKNAPELQRGLEFYYMAFQDLHTCRNSGGMSGDGPISWFAMNDYCDRLGVWHDDREDLIFLVGKMDDAYRKHVAKKHESARMNARKDSKPKRRR